MIRTAVTQEVTGKKEVLPHSVAKHVADATIIPIINRHDEA
jgi:hypothetical protein